MRYFFFVLLFICFLARSAFSQTNVQAAPKVDSDNVMYMMTGAWVSAGDTNNTLYVMHGMLLERIRSKRGNAYHTDMPSIPFKFSYTACDRSFRNKKGTGVYINGGAICVYVLSVGPDTLKLSYTDGLVHTYLRAKGNKK